MGVPVDESQLQGEAKALYLRVLSAEVVVGGDDEAGIEMVLPNYQSTDLICLRDQAHGRDLDLLRSLWEN